MNRSTRRMRRRRHAATRQAYFNATEPPRRAGILLAIACSAACDHGTSRDRGEDLDHGDLSRNARRSISYLNIESSCMIASSAEAGGKWS